jgi:hypothetical protein
VGGLRRRAFLAGARVAAVSQERLPVHGIAIEDVVAVAGEPYRIPDVGEIGEEGNEKGQIFWSGLTAPALPRPYCRRLWANVRSSSSWWISPTHRAHPRRRRKSCGRWTP